MDAFEGIHSVQLSPSLKPAVSSGPGYEVLVTGNSGIAVYSSPTFFGQLNTSGPQAEESRPSTQEEGCAVGRLIDLEPESEPGTGPSRTGTGQAVSMPLAERGADGGKREQYNLSRLRSSSLEIKEKGSEFLKEQLDTAQRELQLKDKECERLSRVRDQLEQELEELTASLFEEAHKMVREANVKQAAAEKQLKEAQGKIDVLQAEVTALKTLVLTSTPSSPNRQMHPQLMSPGLGSKRGTPRRGGGHFRNKSASGSLALDVPSPDRTTTPTNPVFQEGRELSQAVQAAVENNSLTIEPVAAAALPVVKASASERSGPNGWRAAVETKCALTGISRVCQHRIKLGDKGMYYYISPSSRARITAVCNFFTYIRYIQQGLVRQGAEQTFWEVMRLRREMAAARLGYFTADES
ncbi:guanine nucleotide exchange factor for Rab-3A isoform X5 [Paramormyrops kingsleyae]|uniref:guanine nucleotide exchange factor for Rab-3A isoform X5 n=1 Tax=Paramormyrops kingsleyae TaxID=1676925 RepID=UPI003B96F021